MNVRNLKIPLSQNRTCATARARWRARTPLDWCQVRYLNTSAALGPCLMVYNVLVPVHVLDLLLPFCHFV